jgi:hypothetical protein
VMAANLVGGSSGEWRIASPLAKPRLVRGSSICLLALPG